MMNIRLFVILYSVLKIKALYPIPYDMFYLHMAQCASFCMYYIREVINISSIFHDRVERGDGSA